MSLGRRLSASAGEGWQRGLKGILGLVAETEGKTVQSGKEPVFCSFDGKGGSLPVGTPVNFALGLLEGSGLPNIYFHLASVHAVFCIFFAVFGFLCPAVWTPPPKRVGGPSHIPCEKMALAPKE